jgi:DNA polymerase III subunit delta'
MMIGHQAAESAFLNAWQSGRLHHAWLLAGPQGLGKAALAARIARFLLTRQERGAGEAGEGLDSAGDPVAGKLIDAGNHPELILLERLVKEAGKDPARNITVDQVRALNGRMQFTIAIGHWRVAMIDAIDDLEAGAANALLKTLEEPPAQTLFLLISHSPGRLLPTIRSRCRLLRFQPIDDASLAKWLKSQRPIADMGQIQAAVTAAGGIPGRALELVDGDTAAMEKRLLVIATTGDPGNVQREALARDVSGAAGKARFRLLLDLAPRVILRLARERDTAALAPVLTAWDEAQTAGRGAISGSYDPAMVAFDIGNAFAAIGGARAHGGASPRAA